MCGVKLQVASTPLSIGEEFALLRISHARRNGRPVPRSLRHLTELPLHDPTIAELARRLGKARSTVAKMLRKGLTKTSIAQMCAEKKCANG